MNEPLPSICEYDPDMPQSIENIILKAAAKNPQNRYASAMEMHEDLKTALNKDRFNEPKIVYHTRSCEVFQIILEEIVEFWYNAPITARSNRQWEFSDYFTK